MAENKVIVQAYFEMLAMDLSGATLNKKAKYREILPELDGRTLKSIEYKLQNISAVMFGIGQPRVSGLAPAANAQHSLIDEVLLQLPNKPTWHDSNHLVARRFAFEGDQARKLKEIRFGPPPALLNEPAPIEPKFAAELARKFDAAAQDESNRALGSAGEELVLEHERAALKAAGRHDLAKRIQWTAKEYGDGFGYDITSFALNGTERLIEVKTTNGWQRTPFHISQNELAVANAQSERWHLVRLWDFAREPKAFEIRPPLESHVKLTPTSFRAAPL